MKIVKIIFIAFVLHITLYAQITPSASNYLRYGNGTQQIGELGKTLEYTENVFDFRLGLPESINIGFRYVYDRPPEIGPEFNDIKRRFIEYQNSGFYIRAGHSSEIYGKGLALNLFEDRGLAFNTWIDGIKMSYKKDALSASLIAGTIDFRDSVNIARHEIYDIKGGNLNYEISEKLSAGMSFIRTDGKIPQGDLRKNILSEIPEFYVTFADEKFELFVNWARLWIDNVDDKNTSTGYGVYGSFSYFDEGFGLTLDYKSYRFNIEDPFSRFDNTRTNKIFPFQNPPIVMKEHSYTLLSRPLHEVDFNDETGLQIEIYYLLTDNLNLTLNASVASRHNFFNYDRTTFTFYEEERDGNFLPSLDDKYSPYYEMFLEGEYNVDFNTTLNLGIAYRNKVLYNEFTGDAGTHKVTSIVVPMAASLQLTEDLSSQLKYQIEFRDDNFNTSQENFYNQHIDFLTTLYQKFSVTVRYEFTDNDFDVSGRKDWLALETGYRIDSGNVLTLTYGRERGGLVCANGVCRYVLPFKGFRFSLQTII